MDARTFLDELLKAGRELAEQGQSIAKETLTLDESATTEEARLSGLKTGALAAGTLAILLGTKTGRKVTGSAIKLGSLAAIGGVAWKAYQNYQNNNGNAPEATPLNELDKEAANKRSAILLKAMIAAAKADGNVSDDELAEIDKQVKNLGLEGDTANIIQEELVKPLDIDQIAALAEGKEAKAAEIYLVSAVVTDQENEKERQYLADLATAMKIPEELLAELNAYNDKDEKKEDVKDSTSNNGTEAPQK
ncbi:MAG: tellurite resistance TerB family protein [Cocleimonas sp.]|nr:tellurite resistance TerB family protein [Cocleimonas sp.]